MIYLLLIPFLLQASFILIDELYFHPRREVSRWERLGHLLDTFTVFICFLLTVIFPYSRTSLVGFLGVSIFSCLFVTKDEWIHSQKCTGTEMWLHSILFLVHPLVLISAALVWAGPEKYHWILKAQLMVLVFASIYQARMWRNTHTTPSVNNTLYNELGERWYTAKDDPIALLRSESRLFTRWIDQELLSKFKKEHTRILDMGCGGGFLSNALAQRGWKITSIDLSNKSLEVARKYDVTKSVDYRHMDAEHLVFDDETFDVVISLDMLEHVEHPEKVIVEAARVLKKGGSFFFHTFNRTPLSWLFAIKGLEWFVKNTPEHVHVYHLFITIPEFKQYCEKVGLQILDLRGVGPKFSMKTWKPLLFQGQIVDDFEFEFKSKTQIGYAGSAFKR